MIRKIPINVGITEIDEMLCTEVKDQLLDALDNELPLTLQQEVELHLRSCLDCRAELESFRTAGMLLQLRAVPEPPAEYWEQTWNKIQERSQARILPLHTGAMLTSPPWLRVLHAPLRPLLVAAALIVIAFAAMFWTARVTKANRPQVWSARAVSPAREFQVQPVNYPLSEEEHMPSEWRRQRELINISRGIAGSMDPISKSALMVTLEGNQR